MDEGAKHMKALTRTLDTKTTDDPNLRSDRHLSFDETAQDPIGQLSMEHPLSGGNARGHKAYVQPGGYGPKHRAQVTSGMCGWQPNHVDRTSEGLVGQSPRSFRTGRHNNVGGTLDCVFGTLQHSGGCTHFPHQEKKHGNVSLVLSVWGGARGAAGVAGACRTSRTGGVEHGVLCGTVVPRLTCSLPPFPCWF